MEVMQAARSPAFAKRLYSLVNCVAGAGFFDGASGTLESQ